MEYSGKRTLALVQEIMKASGQKEMEYSKVIKLLYFCDRHMYQSNGSSITGDDYISTATGPTLAITQGLIQEEALESGKNSFFHKHFRVKDRNIIIEKKIEGSLLSPEVKLIAAEYAQMFGSLSAEQLSEVSHRVCSEWKDPTNSTEGSYASKISEDDIRQAVAP